MALYSKKLHVIKNGVTAGIDLYTTAAEVGGGNCAAFRDGAIDVYAKLGAVSDVNASLLRIEKSGYIYSVLKKIGPNPGEIIDAYDYGQGNALDLASKGWRITGGGGQRWFPGSYVGLYDGAYLEKNWPSGIPPATLELTVEMWFDVPEFREWTIDAFRVIVVSPTGELNTVYNSIDDSSLRYNLYPHNSYSCRYYFDMGIITRTIPIPGGSIGLMIMSDNYIESIYHAVSVTFPFFYRHKIIAS